MNNLKNPFQPENTQDPFANISPNIKGRLVEGETILARAIIHKGIFWKSIAVMVLALIFAILFAIELGIFLLCVALIMIIYAGAMRRILFFIVTDRRILARYGLLMVDVVDIHFDKIESIELERMLPGMIMGYSNVVVMGTGNRYISIPYVANGPELRKAYNDTVLTKKEAPLEVKIKE